MGKKDIINCISELGRYEKDTVYREWSQIVAIFSLVETREDALNMSHGGFGEGEDTMGDALRKRLKLYRSVLDEKKQLIRDLESSLSKKKKK